MTYYVHEVPGRLRVKNPFMKGNQVLALEMEEFLKNMPGVHSVSTSALTGSTLVHYDTASLDSRQILDTLGTNGHFDPSRAVTSEEYMQQKLSKTGQVIGKALLGVLIGKTFEGTPLSLLSVVL